MLGDRDVRLPALLAGDGEFLIERIGRRARGHDAGDGENDPEADDYALVS
jgi:hypothetical protein